MNQIAVSTRERDDGQVDVAYRIHEAHPLANGVVRVSLASHINQDRAIIAELAALQYLLCQAEVCGPGRTGLGLEVQVSHGAIKRAVLQGALKAADAGRTDKAHIVPYTHFLATRFFAANKTVVHDPAWAKGCMLKYSQHAISVDEPREATLSTQVGNAVISRHALTRFVQRFIARDLLAGRAAGDDEIATIADLDPKYWTRAWKSLARLLISQNTVVSALACSKLGESMVSRHGKQAKYLHHADSQAIFILVPEGRQLVLATVLRDFDDNRLLQRPPRYIGGRLVPA